MSELTARLRQLSSQEGHDGEPWDTMALAADEIDRLTASSWIKTSDRLPSDKIESFHGGPEGSWGCQVLLRIHNYRTEIVYFDSDDKVFWLRGEKVTGDYWMPVPKAPDMEKHP